MSQTQLDLGAGLGLPQGAVAVNRRVWFRHLDGNCAVFVDQTPFYCYPLEDQVLHRFCAIQLVEAGVANVKEVCCTNGTAGCFGRISRSFAQRRPAPRGGR